MSSTEEFEPRSPSRIYWDFLREGRLRFQCCTACDHAWLPPRENCPRCLGDEVQWKDASGQARLISWVVYHHAFHEHLRSRLPYTVAVVELDEGPRLISNIVGPRDPESLQIEERLHLRIEEADDGRFVPLFAPDDGAPAPAA